MGLRRKNNSMGLTGVAGRPLIVGLQPTSLGVEITPRNQPQWVGATRRSERPHRNSSLPHEASAPDPSPYSNSAGACQSAESSVSPVRIRITRSISVMKILPSPTLPVFADFMMASMT